jgi:hypothetical protein
VEVLPAIGLLAELFTGLGLIAGAICGVWWLSLRSSRGGWRDAPGERVGEEIRWIADDGILRTASTGVEGFAPHGDELTVFYRERQPGRPHPHPQAHDERTLRLLAGLLVGVGLLAGAASLVVTLIGG